MVFTPPDRTLFPTVTALRRAVVERPVQTRGSAKAGPGRRDVTLESSAEQVRTQPPPGAARAL
jgi:hypothetical protein